MKTLSRNNGYRFKVAALAAAIVLAVLAVPRRAAAQITAQPEGDKWAVAVAIDLWAPTINGDLKYSVPEGGAGGSGGLGGRLENVDLKIGPNDYLTHLNFVLPITMDIRNKKYSILTDIMYLNLGMDNTRIGSVHVPTENPIEASTSLGTNTKIQGFLWTEAFGWTVVGDPSNSYMDVFVGLQYLATKFETKWHLEASVNDPNGNPVLAKDGNVSVHKNIIDGIVGVRGKAAIGGKWSIPYYGDIGLGSSKVTWSAAAGIDFAPGKMDFALNYRHTSWQEGDNKLVQGLRFGGPELLIGYRF